jgi:hypothetical protein
MNEGNRRPTDETAKAIMPENISDSLAARLSQLLASLSEDCDALQSSPAGHAVFQDLFDAVQSTLQNVKEPPAEKPASDPAVP